MSRHVTGALIGVLVSVFCSLLGVLIARTLGGDIAISATLIHAAATVVLLVNVLVRIEARP